ncbi:MAG: 4Fe-4S dicluster domain-containing protein, partial [Deltaproteobacteria bacterium]|nr:4Fe-4S dicluster domain-containing protein [Deltaproteobacteria bacterium]
PFLGGIPRFAISEKELPQDIVDREVDRIIELGVKTFKDTRIGRDTSLEELEKDHDALLIATGANKSAAPALPDNDRNLEGLFPPHSEDLVRTELRNSTGKGSLQVHPVTMMTNKAGIFGAGEVVTGHKSIAAAIGSGRRAAVSLDAYLKGASVDEIKCIDRLEDGQIRIRKYFKGSRKPPSQHVVGFHELMHPDFFPNKTRIKITAQPLEDVKNMSGLFKGGYTNDEAMEEAGRCFHCGHCFSCGTCVEICPGDVLRMVDNRPELAYPEECIHCGACMIDCPAGAISFHIPLPLTPAGSPGNVFESCI